MTPDSLTRRSLVVLFGAALLIRLLFLLGYLDVPTFSQPEGGDAIFYDRIARGDRTGRAYFHSPLYQWWLSGLYAVFGRNLVVVRVVQHGLGAAACVAVAGLTHRVFGSRRASLLAGAGCAVTGPLVFYEGQLLVDALMPPLLLAAVWATDVAVVRRRPRDAVLAGAAIGLAALGRASVLVWLVLLVVAFARRPKLLAGVALGAGLLIAPATIHNASLEDDVVVISSNGGINLFIGNNPRARGGYNLPPGLWFAPGDPAADFSGLQVATRQLGYAPSSAELSRWWAGRAVDYAAANPGRTLGLAARKAWLWISLEEAPQLFHYGGYREAIPMLSWLPKAWLLLIPGLVGLPLAMRRARPRTLGWATVLMVASFLPFFVVGRYRAAWLVLLAPFAGHLVDRGLVRSGRTRAWIVAALVGSAVVVAAPRDDARKPAIQFFAFGNAAEREGDASTAYRWYRRAVDEAPAYVPAVDRVVRFDLDMRRTEAAAAAVEAALDERPDDAWLHALSGRVRFAEGDHPGAREQLERSVQADPSRVDAWLWLAEVLVAQGKPGDARRALESARRMLEPGDATAERIVRALESLPPPS